MTTIAHEGEIRRPLRLLPGGFLLWLCVFFAGWLVLVVTGDYWQAVVEHWVIAVAMACGSYFAGSTPIGGGAVGFPVLVLLLDEPATLGRDFSFAIQSIGMVSASIYILAQRKPIEWHMLRGGMIGVTIGVPLGALFIVPFVGDLVVKLMFAVLWASFGVMHLARPREIIATQGMTPATVRFDVALGMVIGLCGGSTVVAVTGNGVNMLMYVALVLISRADLRIAIPTSVLLMAYASIVGVSTSGLLGRLDIEVLYYWLAAAPVAVVAGPIGALIVQHVSRFWTLMVVSSLCLAQFAWTCWDSQVSLVVLGVSVGAVLAMSGIFHLLYEWGRIRARQLPRRAIDDVPGSVDAHDG